MSFLKENKFGIIIGFIFGIFSIFLATLGLISGFAGTLGFIFRFPGPLIGQLFLIQTGPNSYSAAVSMPLAIILNAIFYGLVGGYLQKWLKKKKYVIFIFVGIILLFIVGIIIESLIRSSLGLHVGA
jgi:hypothetical protein